MGENEHITQSQKLIINRKLSRNQPEAQGHQVKQPLIKMNLYLFVNPILQVGRGHICPPAGSFQITFKQKCIALIQMRYA